MTPFDVVGWVETHLGKLTEKPKPAFERPKGKTGSNASKAEIWLNSVKPAIEGEGGSAHTFGVCSTLIHGFLLSEEEAFRVLAVWNQVCDPPWNEGELRKKISNASEIASNNPEGWMLEPKGIIATLADIIENDIEPEEPESTPHSAILDDPASIAIRFIQTNTDECGVCIFQYYDQSFYVWDSRHYIQVPKEDMEGKLFWFIEQTYLEKYMDDLNDTPEDKVDKVKKRHVTKKTIAEVTTGLVGRISVDRDSRGIQQSEPFWIGSPIRDWNPSEIIPFEHRLIHIPSFVGGIDNFYRKKTPKYFSTFSLPYRFDYMSYEGEVEPPPLWGKFLNEVWPDDPDSIECLREWFGYLLTPSTEQQKLLMLIGPPRSGKGTILRVLKEMIGPKNYGSTSFSQLGDTFGLENLIDKTVSIIPDARLTSKTDVGQVVERLLSITGEDDQPVNRKHFRITSRRLHTRFIISSNEIPRLTESSGAIVNRSVFISFKNDFQGKEDTKLTSKLIDEIPGIIRWSIDGWKSLNDRGRFLQPASGIELSEEFADLTSNIKGFIKECVEVSPEYVSNSRELFNLFETFSRYRKFSYNVDMNGFLSKMRSAIPGIRIGDRETHNGDGVAWSNTIHGIRVNPFSGPKAYALELEDESEIEENESELFI